MEQRIVLFVDDDPEILKVLRRMVRGMGLTVLTTTGPNASARASYAETLPLTSQRSSSRQA